MSVFKVGNAVVAFRVHQTIGFNQFEVGELRRGDQATIVGIKYHHLRGGSALEAATLHELEIFAHHFGDGIQLPQSDEHHRALLGWSH